MGGKRYNQNLPKKIYTKNGAALQLASYYALLLILYNFFNPLKNLIRKDVFICILQSGKVQIVMTKVMKLVRNSPGFDSRWFGSTVDSHDYCIS